MKPVRRNIRKHFGLTAKQVAVRSKRPWYFQWLIWFSLIAIGYAFAYWQMSFASEQFSQLLTENQSLQIKLIQLQKEVQIEQAAQANLQKELNQIQDENIRVKEELLFYKNMVDGKK
jgi:Flp pilus assembly protein TadB